jgi:hypothetical protein
MEAGKRRTGPVRRVERSFEGSRLAEQLLISAYERVVPVIRHAVRHRPSVIPASEATKTSSAIGAARP